MLDRPPDELLDDILFLACPPTSWPDYFSTDQQRRNILSRCCLLSKRIRKRAQPMLWRKVVVDTEEQARSLTALLQTGAATGLSAVTRVLSGDTVWCPEFTASLGHSFNAVEEVQLHRTVGSPPGTHINRPPPGLAASSLTVYHSAVPLPLSYTTCLTLRSITQLALSNLLFEAEAGAATFLTPEVFPSLRILALSPYHSRTSMAFFPPVSPILLEQLDGLQVKWHNFDVIPSSLLTTSTPVLYTEPLFPNNFRRDYLLLHAPRRIRIIPRTITDPRWERSLAEAILTLSGLAALVSSPKKPLSLHLPIYWRTVDPGSCPETAEAVGELAKACKENEVEIVWCSEGQETEFAVSKEFWEFAKRVRGEGRGVSAGGIA